MSWARFDDQSAFHPKIMRAGNEAVGAWFRMTAWSCAQLTDGAVPISVALAIAGAKHLLDLLLSTGLLENGVDGYLIHDYLDFNPSAEEVRATREARKVAGSRGGLSKPSSKRLANAQAKPKQKCTPIPSPIPSTEIGSEETPLQAQGVLFADTKKALEADTRKVLERFTAGWIQTRRPADGKAPQVPKVDYIQLRGLVARLGVAEAERLIDYYLADADPWLTKQGHALRHLPARADAYRATVTPTGKKGFMAPIPPQPRTEDQDL